MRFFVMGLSLCIVLLFGCKQRPAEVDDSPVEPKRNPPKAMTYQFANAKAILDSLGGDSTKMSIILAANRIDSASFAKLDSAIVPTDLSGDIEFYLPFPHKVDYLRDVKKIIYFSYPTQTFATYERGILVYTGPTSMGSEQHKTTTGQFFANWKAEETISTFNDEWELKWNFNIINDEGIGWHQYSLPGTPASHSCMRLLEKDAKYLYSWADQWELENSDSVKVKGTPCIIYGDYDFKAPKPWLQLVANPKALDISEEAIKNETMPYLEAILAAQRERKQFEMEGEAEKQAK